MARSSLWRPKWGQVREAIYIDFEGHADEPPFLLGVLRAQGQLTTFEQVVLAEEQKWSLPGLDKQRLLAEPLEKSIVGMLAIARDEHRLIAAWSTHELNVIRRWGDLRPKDDEFLTEVYRN